MLQTLENKIAEWKHKIGEYKCQKLALKETSEQKKIALKKVLRSQKQKAQRSEEAVKDVISKIREHVSDYAVSNVVLYCLKLNNWKSFTCEK